VVNDVSARFSFKLLENKIGYLKVVGIGQGNVKEQADFIRKGLVDLKEKGADKWILDLRFNGGGNMEPMISGLAPLIGEGHIGGAINNRNEVTRQYKIENGQFNNNGRIVCEMDDSPKIEATEKVAVLLSRYTISSGEMVAVAFKGRNNTRFIGEESAGYTTGNGFDQINEELALVISQDVFADRNNIRYDKSVGVDEKVEFQHSSDLKNDKQIAKAIEWLND
jgi:C-terminal processing protease CtpA/Prc